MQCLTHMITLLIFFSLFANLTFASELLTLLNEGTLIKSEADYGYSTNSLSYRAGDLIKTPTQGDYEYFEDIKITDAERFTRAIKDKNLGSCFDTCYDPHKQYWEGFCHLGAEASTHPNIHHKITSTKGLVCPTTSGGIILDHMTLRELMTFLFRSNGRVEFYGRRANISSSFSTNDQENCFKNDNLLSHEFHEKAHLALRNNTNFIINVAPGELVFNRVVKSMTSKQEQVLDQSELINYKIPLTHFPDKKIIYHVTTNIYYYDYADFHESGSIYEYGLEYFIFIDRKNTNKIDSFWVGPESYNINIQRNHNKDTYSLTKRPSFIWVIDRSKKDPINSRTTGSLVFTALLDLFNNCLQLEEANKSVKDALDIAKELQEQTSDELRPLLENKLAELREKILWLPLKSEIREKLINF